MERGRRDGEAPKVLVSGNDGGLVPRQWAQAADDAPQLVDGGVTCVRAVVAIGTLVEVVAGMATMVADGYGKVYSWP